MIKNKNLYISIAIVVAAIAVGVYLGTRHVAVPGTSNTPVAGDTDKAFALACDAEKQMIVTFHLPSDQVVDVLLSDGRTIKLLNTSDESQASYTSADGSAELALSGTTLKLTEGSKITYSNCVIDHDIAPGSASSAE